MTVTVSWPMRLVNTTNRREFWAVKAKRVKAQRNATRLMLKAHYIAADVWCASDAMDGQRLAVRLARIYAGRCRPMDDDGVVAAFKSIRDEVAAYFGVDDSDPRIRFEYTQARGDSNLVRIDFMVESDMRTRVELNAAATHRRIADALEGA